jgi:serine/threonine protein kinase
LHKLSRLRVIHRDLKAGNILLDWEMKLRFQILGLQKFSTQMITKAIQKAQLGHSKIFI